ncbi:MAG: hypothetical protein JNM24_17670 [Bdellovibrionaceae bacterium]|nr:hypothetical protein [Pseudobdellovibrionaceae bacterium]
MSDTKIFSNWMEYWQDVEPRLALYVNKRLNKDALEHLNCSLALYSFTTENWISKIKKNNETSLILSIFLIQVQDILRGLVSEYRNQTLTPIALMVRTVFEIKANLMYMIKSPEAISLIDKFDRFKNLEKFLGKKGSVFFDNPTDQEAQEVMAKCNEWFIGGKLIDSQPHWSAKKGINLRKICEASHVNLLNEYISTYKLNSKFTHGSPIINNMYSNQSIPLHVHTMHLAFLGAGDCMKVLHLLCEFFGVDFPDLDYAHICGFAIKATGGVPPDPRDFK